MLSNFLDFIYSHSTFTVFIVGLCFSLGFFYYRSRVQKQHELDARFQRLDKYQTDLSNALDELTSLLLEKKNLDTIESNKIRKLHIKNALED